LRIPVCSHIGKTGTIKKNIKMNRQKAILSVRPYQLMCIVCKIGDGSISNSKNKRLHEILKKIRKNPGIPVVLRCNTESPYKYQNPGKEEDTPEGELFNLKRDLDIIQKLGLVPGSMRPADELFHRLFNEISSSIGICRYEETTSNVWKGCPRAKSGFYKKGHVLGVDRIIPARTEKEKAIVKKKSAKKMYASKNLLIRPHHLMCLACFYNEGNTAPIKEDNLFEAIDIMRKNPNVPITLIPGCCMICPPCSYYNPRTNLCVMKIGGGLRDDKKDLDVLQMLGLKYGDTLPAKKLYQLLFEKIPSTKLICGFGDGIVRGQEWTICDPGNKYKTAGGKFLDFLKTKTKAKKKSRG